MFLLNLKSSSSSDNIEIVRSINSNFRFIHWFTPLLTALIQSFNRALVYVEVNNKLPLYNTPYPAFFFTPNFLSYEPKTLRSVLPYIFKHLFRQYIIDNHSYSTLVFTDGSVTSTSASYAFHISSIHVQSSGSLPTVISSFTAECFAILEAIKWIGSLPSCFYLIITNSQSCL